MWRTAEKRFVPHVCSSKLFAKTFDSWRDQRVRNCELLSRDQNLLSSLDPSNSYSCLSQWSFDYIDFLVRGLQGHLLWHLAKVGAMFPCNNSHEAMNKCRDSLPEAWGPWARQHAPSAHHYGCIMPIPSLQLQKKKPVSCREAMGLVMELWSPRFVTYNTVIDCVKDLDYKRYYYWLCSQLWHNVTAANQWTNLSNSELEVGVAGLSAAHLWKKLNQCRKEICSTCLSVCLRNPCLVWNLSLHCLPEAWGPWEPQYAPTVLHCACIMPIPSLQLQKKDQSHAEKQRVWSRSCGLETKNCCKESF